MFGCTPRITRKKNLLFRRLDPGLLSFLHPLMPTYFKRKRSLMISKSKYFLKRRHANVYSNDRRLQFAQKAKVKVSGFSFVFKVKTNLLLLFPSGIRTLSSFLTTIDHKLNLTSFYACYYNYQILNTNRNRI